ncbi:Fc.00g101940.m01.CDS01 [Cosmosporella sp. VM-42]
MGGGMTKVLLKAGFEVIGFDVYQPSVEKLIQAGGRGATRPVDVGRNADVLILMVTNSSQIKTVLFDKDTGAVHELRKKAAVVVSSTVSPEFCDEVRQTLDEVYHRQDVFLLDCPVSGGASGAANGTLSIFSAGPSEGLAKAHPVFEALSSRLYTIPGGIGFGSKAKMCHQVLPEVEIALANEVMALAARAGLNTQEVYEAVQKSDGWSWINGNRIPHMLDGDKTIYSAVLNSQKDSSIIVNASRLVSFPVFLTAAAEQVYIAAINAGWAKDDDSTIWRLYLPGYPDDVMHQLTKENRFTLPRNESISVQDIIDIFSGGHLAAATEGMGFTEAVGLDTDVMYDIISQAAGSNTQFVDQVPKMKKPTWSLRDLPAAKSICERLENALLKANSIGASMPVAAASLQLFKLHLQ